jgi:NAD(P)-dependent dehydrogenase (short-subunit alcohol dehydrogenase family)
MWHFNGMRRNVHLIRPLDPASGRESGRLVNAAGGEAMFVHTDVTNENSVREAVAAAVRRFTMLNVLYNCAGGSLPEDSLVTDVDLDKIWDITIPLYWVGLPEDIASIALFPASDESRMITGATIPAEGGRSAY